MGEGGKAVVEGEFVEGVEKNVFVVVFVGWGGGFH